jgi:hypothetical protein
VKIRLHGTQRECEDAAGRLGQVLGVLSVSRPYPDRSTSSLVRLYVETRLCPQEHPAAEASGPPDTGASARARETAATADTLADAIGALQQALRSASEPVRRAGFRCDTAIGWVRQVARDLLDTAADLDRIAAAAAPGTCSVPWGACPEHGNTLASTAGKTWCRVSGCGRAWDYDRGGLPCAESARWKVTDQYGVSGVMCDGHAHDARERLERATVVPLEQADS